MFALLFSMEGRISRSQYWLLWLIQTVIGGGLFYASITATAPSFAMAGFALELVVLWMVLCRIGKRLHDRGKSAWLTLGWFVPVIGLGWELIACGFAPGDPHDNVYGPAPGRGAGEDKASGDGQMAKLDDEYFRKMAEDLRLQHSAMQTAAPPQNSPRPAPASQPIAFGKRRG